MQNWNIIQPLKHDSSMRRYTRVESDGEKAIMMQSLPDSHPDATPGHAIADFVRLADWLNAVGLNAPDVYEGDADAGRVVMQDFGDVSLGDAPDQLAAYLAAADVLARLAEQEPPQGLQDYAGSRVDVGRRFVLDWYFENPEAIHDFDAAWVEIEAALPPCPQGFMHIDYHAGNLMWLPDETGLQRIGILDFQGAMVGPLPYDLVNLLEDTRRDIPQDIKGLILKRYDADFISWYQVLAAQFHCRVIGQFIKIAHETGNESYLAHIPRLEGYMRRHMKEPLLAPVARFFAGLGLDFSGRSDFNIAKHS